MGIKRLIRSCIALALLATAVVGASAGSAAAEEGFSHLDSEQYSIESFSTATSSALAGGRTEYRNVFEMKWEVENEGPDGSVISGIPYGRTKTFEFDLPPGLTGDPTAVPTCSLERFLRFYSFEGCPVETQVGTATVKAYGVDVTSMVDQPIFNLAPGPDEPALFGLKLGTALYAFLEIEVSSDGELTAVIDEVPIAAAPFFSDATMFGVVDPTPGDGDSGDEAAFMSNPTNCAEPFTTDMRGASYEFKFDTATFTETPRTNCEDLPFDPSIAVEPTSRVAGGPTGLNVDITVPQSEDPDEPASAHVKDVSVTLPEGMVLSSSSAAGLGSCSPEQFGYHEETPISCPLDSKVGEVEVETHILDEPLKGPVYVAKQNDNPFDSLIALYMAPAGSGVELKLAGKVDLDPNTGRLTSTFLNNPQQPFSELHVRLKDGPRAPLALPSACGTYTAAAELTSWAMPDEEVPLADSFTVDQGCGRQGQFSPALSAGTLNPQAGAFSPFTLRVVRADNAQQNLSRIEATLPEGLLAKLAGVPLCGEAEAASGNCPAASQVGTTTVGAGAGPDPIFVPQPGRPPTAAYLAGPYKGAPYSLVVKVPAQAGPFDLGTVTVRNALHVDPSTTQVTAKSDPLPQILQGVPISYRDVRVDVDRPNFILNPTSCEPMAITSTLVSVAGAVANPGDRFQATGCRKLSFGPKLSLSLSGQTRRSGNPALKAVLTQPSGQANIDHVQVVLPRSAFIDNEHVNNPCTRAEYAAQACPPASILGTVTATTPLLDQPLTGNVYFRANGGVRELPDMVAALRGQISVDLVGFIDAVQNKKQGTARVRTTFALVPDAPVTRFEMSLKGGKLGLIENSVNLCKAKRNRASVVMDGQNGRAHDTTPVVRSACGPKSQKRR